MRKRILLPVWVVLSFSLACMAAQSGTKLHKGVFLVASPSLQHTGFQSTVILVTHYSVKNGSMGVTLNRSTDVPLKQLFPQLQDDEHLQQPLFAGGPVQPGVMVILAKLPNADNMEHIIDDLYLGTGLVKLRQIVQSNSSQFVRVYAGYAGWYPGQLEAEIQRGDWLVVPFQDEMVFHSEPETVWEQLVKQWSGVWL